jgi:DNA processing protein
MELRGRYEMRDRLQALFSNAVILAASYSQSDKGKDSGSRLAMRDALKYNIKRAVIFNEKMDKDNPMYNLSREVLQDKDKVIIINGETLEQSINEITKIRPNVCFQSSLL